MGQGWGEREGEKPAKVMPGTDRMVRVTMKVSVLSEMPRQRIGGHRMEG